MKLFLVGLVVTGLSTWVSSETAKAVVIEPEPAPAQYVLANADAPKGAREVEVVFVGEPDQAHTVSRVVKVKRGDDDGRSEKEKHVIMRIADGRDRGWLGVSIGNVSAALADQLNLANGGVVIQNVVEDSPADKGGLRVHDILLSIDGEEVGNDVSRSVDLIKKHQPKEDVKIEVLRNGRKRELTITLGSRSQLGESFEWKVELTPDAEFEDRVSTFGRILRRNDDGDWVVEDLDDLNDLKDLPKNLRMFIPKSGSRSTQVFVESGTKKIKTKVERDGHVLVVEKDGDDGLTVTRIDKDGNKTEKVYPNADELKKADEEAYDALQDINEEIVIDLNADDGDRSVDDSHLRFKFDSDVWKEHFGEWQEKLEQSLAEAREAQALAQRELHELFEKWKTDGSMPDDFNLDGLRGLLHLQPGLHFGAKAHLGRARHTFELRDDGSIEVRSRRGDAELVRVFDSEDDLARRNPKLYERYEKLVDADEEE